MNSQISSLYDIFLKFTNDFSERYKYIFIKISDVADIYNNLVLVSAVVTSTNVGSNPVTYSLNDGSDVPKNVLIMIKQMLEHTLSVFNTSITLSVTVNETPYEITYTAGTYVYPKEVASVVKALDLEIFFRNNYSVAFPIPTTVPLDIVIRDILGRFFDINVSLINVSPSINIFFDIASGRKTIASDTSAEEKDILNKKMKIESISKEIHSFTNVYSRLSEEITIKKQKLEEISKINFTSSARTSQLEMLRTDIENLNQGIAEKTKLAAHIDKILPSIIDSLSNDILEVEKRKELREKRQSLENIKKTYENVIADAHRALDTIAPKVKQLESEHISATVNMDISPEELQADINKMVSKADSFSNSIRELSDNVSVLKKDITIDDERKSNMSFVNAVNFEETNDYLKLNTVITQDHLFLFNFLTSYIKYLLTTDKPEHIVPYIYKQFGF